MNQRPRVIVLAILDGWGIAPPSPGNAVTLAKTPILQRWDREYLHTKLLAGGTAVGLAPDQDGNSEAGHMNLGAGRVVVQDNIRISQSINDGRFFVNPAFMAAVHHVTKHHSTLHIMGMLGNSQSAHANPDHLIALLTLVASHKLPQVRLHLFTDGRDSPRYMAREIMTRLLPHFGAAKVGTIMGRYYGMDRNKNWERTERAYRALTAGLGDHHVDDPMAALTQAYNRGETDEFITPTVVGDFTGVQDNDAIIYFNLRSDRARQLTKAFVQPDFEARNGPTHCFTRQIVRQHLTFVAMTEFGPDLGEILTAFPAVHLRDTLPMVLRRYRQLYIAESEKYAHITFFFNGGYADPVGGEQRDQVPSPAVPFYDQVPAMSSTTITDRVIYAINNNLFDIIVVNYAQTDMVAHTGNLSAGVKAMESADACLGRMETAIINANGVLLVTADHGNLEEMVNLKTSEVDTEHSCNPVPFYLVTKIKPTRRLRDDGVLGDVAPTIIDLFGLNQPAAMTGRTLMTR